MASTRIWASFVVAGASCLSVQAARFTAGNLVVLKVGDTSINEKASAQSDFLTDAVLVEMNIYTSPATIVQTIPLTPGTGASAGTNFAMAGWNGGKGPGDGGMQLSNDQQYLVFGGYNGTIGVDGVEWNPSCNCTARRVVGRVNFTGVVETIASVNDAFNTDTFRSVCSYSAATGYYMAGHGTFGETGGDSYGAIHWVAAPSTYGAIATTSVEITGPGSGYSNARSCRIVNVPSVGYNGVNVTGLQLFSTTTTGGQVGVNVIANAIPGVTGAQPSVNQTKQTWLLPGFPISSSLAPNTDPTSFLWDPSGTLWLTDTNPTTNSNTAHTSVAGLHRYQWNTPTNSYILTGVFINMTCIGLTGLTLNTTGHYTLFVSAYNYSAADTTGGYIFAFDTVTLTATVVYHSPNVWEQFRGLDWAPTYTGPSPTPSAGATSAALSTPVAVAVALLAVSLSLASHRDRHLAASSKQ